MTFEQHVKFINDKYGADNRIFTALIGSQNYGLSDENSDMDTVSAFIPSFDSLILNKSRVAKINEMPDLNHAEIKDIRSIFDWFYSSDINPVSLLYSCQVDVNPHFEWLWETLQTVKPVIAYYNPGQMVYSLEAQIRYYCDMAFKNPFEKYNSKKLATAYRLLKQLSKYSYGAPFEEVLNCADIRDMYLYLKQGKMPEEEARVQAKVYKGLAQEYLLGFDKKAEGNTELKKFLDDLLIQLFKGQYGI